VKSTLFLAFAASLAFAACSKNEPAPAANPAQPPAAAATAQPTARSLEPAQNVGKVLQVQQAGPYTYAEVESEQGQRAWIAGTAIEVKPGDKIQWGDYSVMRNFNAKSLNRTFDEILFVNAWGPVGAPTAATPAHGSLPTNAQLGAPDPGAAGVVKSVASGGGYSYLEVERNGEVVWVAAPETQLKPGDKVQWSGASEMRNFTAKSLNRTFERIIFASAVTVAK
jgi:hypothetical protein